MNNSSTQDSKPLVLLIDDQSIILERFGAFLREDHNFEVITAANSEDALLCAERLPRPAIVILDRMFRNKHGDLVLGEKLLPVLRERARFPIITIFHSGDVSEEAELEALSAGAYWYLAKGINHDLFIAYIWLAVNVIRQVLEPNEDPLTGTLNRRAMFERTTSELSRAERLNITTVCMFFDVDTLKVTNDIYGHSTGDKVIVSVVDSIREHLRPNDVVCRYGGDEIIIFLFDVEEAWANKFAHEVCLTIKKKTITANNLCNEKGFIRVSASVGVATLSYQKIRAALGEVTETNKPVLSRPEILTILVEELIAKADEAMIQAKKGKE